MIRFCFVFVNRIDFDGCKRKIFYLSVVVMSRVTHACHEVIKAVQVQYGRMVGSVQRPQTWWLYTTAAGRLHSFWLAVANWTAAWNTECWTNVNENNRGLDNIKWYVCMCIIFTLATWPSTKNYLNFTKTCQIWILICVHRAKKWSH